MSGVTEWGNAVFLWVNVDDGGGYANLFKGNLKEATAEVSEESSATRSAMKGLTRDVLIQEKAISTGHDIDSPERWKRTAATDETVLRARDITDGTDNDSGETELRMTWYAGGRMAKESALIRRLLRVWKPEDGCDDVANAETASKVQLKKATVEDKIVKVKDGGSVGTHRSSKRSVKNEPVSPGKGAAALATFSEPPITNVTDGEAKTLAAHAQIDNSSIAEASQIDPATAVNGATAATADDSDHPTNGGNCRGGIGGCQDTVLLFCRLPKEPYVFCGRLGYAQHWPEERPVRFVWRLLDAGRLASWPDFKAIVKAAGVSAKGKEKGT